MPTESLYEDIGRAYQLFSSLFIYEEELKQQLYKFSFFYAASR